MAEVQKIEISSALDNRKTTIFFDGTNWKIAERANAQADTLMIANFLQELAKIKPLKEVDYQDGDQTLQKLNLLEHSETIEKNGKMNIPGIRLVLYDKNNEVVLSMILGRGHIRPLENQMDQPQLDGRYIAVKKDDGSLPVFLISNTLQNCIPIPGVWLEKLRILNAQQLYYMVYRKLKTADQSPQILWSVMTNPEKTEYVLQYPPDKKLSQQELSKKIQLLMHPVSLDLLTDKKPEDVPFTDLLQIVLNTGYNYQLKLFKGTDGRMLANLEIAFFPDHIVRMYGETDEQFAQRKTELAERYEFEKNTYHNKVFVVRNDLIDSLSTIPE